MIIAHSIFKMAQRIAHRDKGYVDRRIIHPVRDWLFGLAGAGLLLLGSGMGAVHLFLVESESASDEHEVIADSAVYDSKLVKRVLTDYAARQARYESLRGVAVFVPIATGTEATSTDKVLPVAQ